MEFHKWVNLDDPTKEKLDSKFNETHRTLFCPGMPGAGKTFLASIVIHHLQQLLQPNDVALALFFCNFRETVTLDEILAALLKQFVRQQSSIPQSLAALFEKQVHLTTNDIITCLKAALSTFSKSFLVLDALDECDIPNNLRIKLFSELRAIQESFNLRVFATSRDNPEITGLFTGCLNLRIQASPEDVKRYLNGRIEILPSFVQKRPELQNEIITVIAEGIDGMFLLARLHIDSLQGKHSVKSIREGLKNLPAGLDTAYADAMSRIESQLPDEVETAKDVLCWISYATKPLTPLELQHALAIEDYQPFLDEDNIPDIEDLISVCAGLVTVDEESGVIRLVHYTTQEYFDRNRLSLFPDAHRKIATRCIHYPSFDAFKDEPALRVLSNLSGESLLKKSFPLIEYSVGNLRHHINLQAVHIGLILGLLRLQGNVEVIMNTWATVNKEAKSRSYRFRISPFPQGRRGIHLAACLDQVEALKILLEEDESGDADIRDYNDQTPLLFAVEYNSQVVAEFLLNRGVNLGSVRKTHPEETPLMLSIKLGHLEMARLLIESGVDMNSPNNRGITPLGLAAGRGVEAAVRYLVGQGATITPEGQVFNSPLGRAALKGKSFIFNFLARLVDDSYIRPIMIS